MATSKQTAQPCLGACIARVMGDRHELNPSQLKVAEVFRENAQPYFHERLSSEFENLTGHINNDDLDSVCADLTKAGVLCHFLCEREEEATICRRHGHTANVIGLFDAFDMPAWVLRESNIAEVAVAMFGEEGRHPRVIQAITKRVDEMMEQGAWQPIVQAAVESVAVDRLLQTVPFPAESDTLR